MLKVLIVDDEREEREGIAFLLQKFGYSAQVFEASNGKEALLLLEKEKIDIVFTDIRMPIMSGLELAEEIRKSDKQMRIVLFSAYSDFEYAKQAIKVNALDYLLKPIELTEFKKLMDQVLTDLKTQKSLEAKLRSDHLYKILMGYRLSDQEGAKMWEFLSSRGKGKRYLARLIFREKYFEYFTEPFLDHLHMYFGENVEYVPIYVDEGYLFLWISGSEAEKLLKLQMNKLLRDIFQFEKGDGKVILSSSIDSLEDMYAQITAIENYRNSTFQTVQDRVFTLSENLPATGRFSAEIEEVTRLIIGAIAEKDSSLVAAYNESLLETLNGVKAFSRIYVQNSLYSILRAAYEAHPQLESENILMTAEKLFTTRDSKKILEYYRQEMERVIELLNEGKAEKKDIISRVCTIIEKEYINDITLNEIADKVNMNPAYLSHMFKEAKGITISKYITDLKMKRAVFLLKNENMKVNQVAKQCGFDTVSYFNRIFKVYYGVTPKQFKES